MKVLGLGEQYGTSYICEIGHTELSKFLGKFHGKLGKLKPGDVVDLGTGYDHASEIASAVRTIQDYMKAHKAVFDVINKGLAHLEGGES